MPDLPSLSVVIPTYNRRARLERVLSALARQSLDEPFETVVVSDGSDDGTDEYLLGGATPLEVVAVTQENQGPAAARNAGIERARGDLIVFVDDDVVATPELLRLHLEAHRRLGPSVVVIGPMLNPVDHDMEPWVRWEQAMLAKQYRAMETGRYAASERQFYTGNASVRRAHLDAVGGFDTGFRRAEDLELAYRLKDRGLEFHFEPDAVGFHYAERSYGTWCDIGAAYGHNAVIFARDLGRDQIFARLADDFRRHHVVLRWLIRRSVHSRRWRTRTTAVLGRLACSRPGGRVWPLARATLSGVYAVQYHCGIADELGSPAAFEALVRG